MNPIEIERRVRRLDIDVQSIYELLMAIQVTQARQGNRLDDKLDTVLEPLRNR